MKPFRHARNSARHFGGKPEDYIPIHDFLDQSKMTVADMRHRALFHNTLGPYLVEQMFGKVAKNSAGRSYSPRDVAEQHIFEDLGTIPPVSAYLNNMALQAWMGGPRRKKPWRKKMAIEELKNLGKEFKRRQKAFEDEAKGLLERAFKEYFEKHGDKVRALTWTQYTPYFNDGEPCVFSVGDMILVPKSEGGEEVDPDDDDFDPDEDGEYLYHADADDPVAKQDAVALANFLSEHDEIALAAYDDHVRVTATASGVETERYSHD